MRICGWLLGDVPFVCRRLCSFFLWASFFPAFSLPLSSSFSFHIIHTSIVCRLHSTLHIYRLCISLLSCRVIK